MTPKNPLVSSRRQRGLTLVELMVAMTIMGVASVGVCRFMIHGLNIYHYDMGRIKVNKDVRSFTEEMTTNAVYSNYFRIYTNFATRTKVVGSTTVDGWVADGQSGDFLLLVFCDTDLTTGRTMINRFIGYYRNPTNASDPASTGPVRKFDVSFNPVDPTVSGQAIWNILSTQAPTANANTNPIVLQLAQGLANGNLFYDFRDHSVMIRGQIVEQGDQLRRAINTYNFTVSPRG